MLLIGGSMNKDTISSAVQEMIFKYAAKMAELQSQRAEPVPIPVSRTQSSAQLPTAKVVAKVVQAPVHKPVTLEDAHAFMRTINQKAASELERHKHEIKAIQEFTGTYQPNDPHGTQLDTAHRKAVAVIRSAKFPAIQPTASVTVKGYVAGVYDANKVQVDNLLAQRKMCVEEIAKYFHADDQVNLGLEQLRLEQINNSLAKLGY
jgi:hypothetical protein